jgi:cell division initiation protein
MRLTPLDIHHKEFRNSLRGYNAEEVDQFLDEVADEFERLFKENIELSEQVEAAEVKVREYAENERTIQHTLLAAQRSADETTDRSQRQADQIVRDAEVKAKEIVQDALAEKQQWTADLSRVRGADEEFRASFREMLRKYLREIGDAADDAVPSDAESGDVVAEAVAEVRAVNGAAPAPKPIAPFKPDLEAAAETEPAAREAVGGSTEPLVFEESSSLGSVRSLSLGEIGETDLEEDIPTLDTPDEFSVPRRSSFGERDDDVDIEEID